MSGNDFIPLDEILAKAASKSRSRIIGSRVAMVVAVVGCAAWTVTGPTPSAPPHVRLVAAAAQPDMGEGNDMGEDNEGTNSDDMNSGGGDDGGDGGSDSGASVNRECESDFMLMTVREALAMAPAGSANAVRAKDENKDGNLCVNAAPGGGLDRFVDN